MISVTKPAASDLIQQLLMRNGWRNNEDTILEAFPHMSEMLEREEILRTLDNLKINYTEISCKENQITNAECPALVIPAEGRPYIVLSAYNGMLDICYAEEDMPSTWQATQRACDVICIDQFGYQTVEQDTQSVRDAFQALRPMLPWVLAASLLTNVMGLLAPLLIMVIYDRVIPSGSVHMIVSLSIGVAVIGACDLLFRQARTKALAFVGWQGERKLTISLFRKLMSLPLTQLQKSDTNQQLSRFRQFEALREMFTGQVMTTLIDLPFALIFFAALTYLAPTVGVFTLCVIVVLFVLAITTVPYQKRLEQASAEAAAHSQRAAHDAILNQKTLSNLGVQQQWLDRSLPLAEKAESTARRARQFQNLVQSISQSVTSVATVGAIIISAYGALSGSLSFGALIASIALVSKVLAPIQALYGSLPQLLSFRDSRVQADRVLNLQEEMEIGLEQAHQKTLSGSITFSNVTYRPDPLNAPLLSQASFTCEPGEFVLIMGCDATSRTAILDLIDGLYTPLAGTIEHDGIDIRQIAVDELRKSVTYATFEKALFYGTVAQNFRLSAPTLSDADIDRALQDMGLLADRDLLPDGAETRLKDHTIANLPDASMKSLTLARGMARKSAVYLFSEPTNGLGPERRQHFKEWVNANRGDKTIVVATADRSFIDLADRFVFLNGDKVAVHDTGDNGRKKIVSVLKALGG